ncbi:Uncharacterised protein [Mycobacteroides abscessus subsp. abscessus]|nr:Uncharacterised protein [Mycobacteroides abscessus subsp. abscessus]SIM60246.1 Uncharacterised protein [Mycobacteroides abscessus subsp. abscessus]SKU63604.1 Uncharacterised protein [Mycobacteroides abscessus subsp. abscessus]
MLQRIRLVADLGEVALGEFVGVGDHHAAARQVADVRLQRRRVHRHQHIGPVARGEDVVVGNLNLERGDTGQRALRGADLGRVIRLGCEVVAEDRSLGGESVSGELHTVARVSSKPDDDFFQLLRYGSVAHR